MKRSAVRAVWTVAPACALAVGLATGVRADGQVPSAPTAPAPGATKAADPSNEELRQELELLKKHVAELEQRLNQRAANPGSVQLQEKKDDEKGEPKGEEKGGKDEGEAEEPPDTAKSVTTTTGSKLLFSGFAQLRVTNIGNIIGDKTPRTNFDDQITRFRPHLTYIHDAHWSSELDINGSTRQDPGPADATTANFSPRDAFIQWQNAGLQARIGQSKIPFGYECYLEGDPVRVEMERARIISTLFPDERDIGMFFRTVPNPKHPRAIWGAVAYYNGNGINHEDNNDNKDVAGTIKVPVDQHNTVGISAEHGDFRPTDASPNFRREALGIEHQYVSKRFFSKFEAIGGDNLGHDIWGGYLGMHYNSGHYGGPFARYDVFEPNVDRENNMWRRLAMGWFVDLTKHVRITGEYDRVTNELVPDDVWKNTYAVQVQTIF